MTIPVFCDTCGDIVGEQEARLGANYTVHLACPGKGKHQPVRRTESKPFFFGWLRKIHLVYPETGDMSSWHEYIGPASEWRLTFAIKYGVGKPFGFPFATHDGVTVNGKWVWYSSEYGLYGEGLAELGLPE